MLFLLILLLFPVFTFAQQPPPSCEQSLAQTQARLELLGVNREQGEQIASSAVAGLRQQNSELQAKVRELEGKMKTLEEAKAPKK